MTSVLATYSANLAFGGDLALRDDLMGGSTLAGNSPVEGAGAHHEGVAHGNEV